MSVSGGCCAVVGSGGGSRGEKPRVGGCALCWVGLGSVVVGLGSLVWWVSVSVSGGCCVVLRGGGGGRGAKPRVGGCALGVGRCVFRGLGQDFAKMVHFRLSENLENNFRQHVVLLEYLPTRYCWGEFPSKSIKTSQYLELSVTFAQNFELWACPRYYVKYNILFLLPAQSLEICRCIIRTFRGSRKVPKRKLSATLF